MKTPMTEKTLFNFCAQIIRSARRIASKNGIRYRAGRETVTGSSRGVLDDKRLTPNSVAQLVGETLAIGP